MFLCKAPPPAPVFAPDLEKLGFELRDGAFVKKGSSPPEYFDFFHTDDDQTNERRKEAIHEAARAAVASELEKKYDIKQVYIASDGEVATIKPSEAHITLLATEVSKLRTKRDVIIVVGEEAAGKQDAGIWAYRALMNEGGMEKGSAVGLAKMLVEQAKGAAAREDDSKGGSEEDLVTSTAKLSTTDNDVSGPNAARNLLHTLTDLHRTTQWAWSSSTQASFSTRTARTSQCHKSLGSDVSATAPSTCSTRSQRSTTRCQVRKHTPV